MLQVASHKPQVATDSFPLFFIHFMIDYKNTND
jgi:hypothetical protein